MRRLSIAMCAAFLAVAAPLAARADEKPLGDPWSVTVYVGPFTTKYIGAVLQSFNDHPTAVLGAVAVDRRLIDLGWDSWLSIEGQAGQTMFGHNDALFSAGLGFIFYEPFGLKRTTFSLFDGPSWDNDPPYLAIGYKEKTYPEWRVRFLNYVGFQIAGPLAHSQHWDAVFQIYHRSGMFGVFSIGDDESTTFGVGLRYHF